MTPKLALFLREYKAERESLSLHLGKLLSLDDLVSTNERRKPIDPSTLTHNFGRMVKHVTPGLQEAAAKQLDSVLPIGVSRKGVSYDTR